MTVIVLTAYMLSVSIVLVRSSAIDHERSLMIQPSQGCRIPVAALNCMTEDGVTIDILDREIVAKEVVCLCKTSSPGTAVKQICTQHGTEFVWRDLPGLPGATRSIHLRKRLKRGWLGGLFRGLTCVATIGIVCGHSGSSSDRPPNKSPTMTCAAIEGSNTVIARAGKLTAPIKWTDPVATDPEDGSLSVQVYPSSFKSGNEFSEGTYVVSFWAADSQGLSVQCAISFVVKVHRCSPQRWPDNGSMKCTGSTLGNTCSIQCDDGYHLDNNLGEQITCTRAGWSSPTRDCSSKVCDASPQIPHGVIYCPRNKAVFGKTCTVVCDEGYRRSGSPFMFCDENGNWNSPPTCSDTTSPVFIPGSCPNDIQANIDSSNNTAIVTWERPAGTDNSGEPPIITERHHYRPGQRFTAGAHTVSYRIEDSDDNQGFPCIFLVQVQTISCQPPSLNVEGAEHMMYNCPDLYRLGAVCTLSCRSGYPLGGVKKIQCLNDGSDPPVLSWHWDQNGLKPFCKETQCPVLPAPTNGALACSLWDHGRICQLQCQQGYDVPLLTDGLFVCGKSNGKWRPDDNVPNCNLKLEPQHMHLKSGAYYYTHKCNSSASNLLQIRENFVKALNASKYHEACFGVPECRAEFVNVTCGLTTIRRRRSIDPQITKRNTTRLAYTVIFNLLLPFAPVSGISTSEIFSEKEHVLYAMSHAIETEFDRGHFNMSERDMTIGVDSFRSGVPEFACPEGTMPKQATASCLGCPTGRFFSKESGNCQYCPIGTYQDIPYSTECKLCPPGSNTTEKGAIEIQMCREYCKAGYHSPSGLSPCAACDSTSYQSHEMSTKCVACKPSKRTISEGASSKSSCQSFDVRLDRQKTVSIKSPNNVHALTLSTWAVLKQNEDAILFRVNSTDELYHITVLTKQTLIIQINGSTFDTGKTLHISKWYHIVVSLDGNNKSLAVYVNGRSVYYENASSMTRTLLVQSGDNLEISGDLQLSSYNILSYAASPADAAKWSSSCESSMSGAFVTSDTIASFQSVNVIIPSMCDAVDECDSSPCGRHVCINKKGDYECRCLGGYTGDHCETKPDFCIDNACKYGATCVEGASNYTCTCAYGYSGDECEIKAVDGRWSAWTEWVTCSKSCGGGHTSRTRQCINPSPGPEGMPCQGPSSESKDCNQDKCPECTTLRSSYGVVRECNKTDTLTRCTISCRPGLYFATPPLSYYECGAINGYKWNHQTDDNPTARLPACSEVKLPLEMGISLDGHYRTMPCSESNNAAVLSSLKVKLYSLECVKKGFCESKIEPKDCEPSASRNHSGHMLTITVHLKITVKTDGSDFNLSAILGNKSAPTASLVDFIKQTSALEKSVQYLFNNFVNFFKVTVNGKSESVDTSSAGMSVTQSIKCPSGSVRLDVLCAECPAGSYSDGYKFHFCPRGKYQDKTGQSACMQCPQWQTTIGPGSVDISECEDVIVHSKHGNDDDKKGATIAISVCVSVGLLTIAAVFLYRYFYKRNSGNNDNMGVKYLFSWIVNKRNSPKDDSTGMPNKPQPADSVNPSKRQTLKNCDSVYYINDSDDVSNRLSLSKNSDNVSNRLSLSKGSDDVSNRLSLSKGSDDVSNRLSLSKGSDDVSNRLSLSKGSDDVYNRLSLSKGPDDVCNRLSLSKGSDDVCNRLSLSKSSAIRNNDRMGSNNNTDDNEQLKFCSKA